MKVFKGASKLVQMIVHTGESIQRGFQTGANDSAPIGDCAVCTAARSKKKANRFHAACNVHSRFVHIGMLNAFCNVIFYDVTLGTVLCTLGLLLYGVPMCCAVCSAKLRALCCAQNYCNDSASNGQLQQQWHACMMSF